VLGTSEVQSGYITAYSNINSNDLITTNTYRSFMGATYTDGFNLSIGRYFTYRSAHGGYLNYNNQGFGFYSQGGYPRMFFEVISGNHGTFSNIPSDSPIKNGYIYQQIKGPVGSGLSSPIKATNNNSQWLWGVKSNGDIIVAAKIESREVKVIANAGADFVFEESYDLPTLEFIENHIKENKHLPEIASAKEMKQNGVNIGKFQIQLLQKIEELTLYTIQQQKEIERLKSVEERLTKLEKMLQNNNK